MCGFQLQCFEDVYNPDFLFTLHWFHQLNSYKCPLLYSCHLNRLFSDGRLQGSEKLQLGSVQVRNFCCQGRKVAGPGHYTLTRTWFMFIHSKNTSVLTLHSICPSNKSYQLPRLPEQTTLTHTCKTSESYFPTGKSWAALLPPPITLFSREKKKVKWPQN